MKAFMNCGQLCGSTTATEGKLPLRSLKALPDFACSDLLNTSGYMENPILDGSSPKPAKESDLTWVHLTRYYTHLLNLRHISRSTRRQVEFMSAFADSCLTLKLTQLHTFFIGHLAGYKEECVIPDPPTALILEPKTARLFSTVADLYPWASQNTQQLCIQWYQPMLAPTAVTPNTIMLVFAMNKPPLSPTMEEVTTLEAGQRVISTEGLKALQGQLVVTLREVEDDRTVINSPVPTMTTPSSPKQERNKSPYKPYSSSNRLHKQMLLEKTRHICTEIRDLLKPDLEALPFTEVPFESSIQTLCVLECCFNPAKGATVEDRALSDWLFSLLV